MIVRAATFPALWVDCDGVFTDAELDALWSLGIRGIFVYLGLVTAADVQRYIAKGFEIMPVTFARKPDSWAPSAALGLSDGQEDVRLLKALGLPPGHHVAHDLEGCQGPAAATEAYLDTRSAQLVTAGQVLAALYVGAEDGGLGGAQLYERPHYTLYWKSLSAVPEPTCGWGFIQLYKSVTLAGRLVDADVPCFDYKDRLPQIVAAA